MIRRFRPVWFPVVLAALLPSAGCGPQEENHGVPDAAEAASLYIEAIGGRAALEGITTLHTIDSVSMAGITGTSESWWTREPFSGRVSMRIGPVASDLLISGDSVWSLDTNGSLSSGDGTAHAQAALARLTVFQDAFLDPAMSGLSAGTDTTISGERAIPLRFQAGEIPVVYYISRESGLPLLMKTELYGMEMLSMPSGFIEAGGILFPGSTRDSIPALGQVTASRSILIECDKPIPDSVFMIAAGGGDVELPEPGRLHEFDLYGQHIYIEGTVCGRETDLILDSGAGATVLDESLAAELGLLPTGGFSAAGIGGVETFGFAVVPEYSALGATVKGQTLAVVDLDGDLYPLTGRHAGMILGYDFLSRFVTTIDYGSETAALHPAGVLPFPGDAVALPAETAMRLLVVEAVLEDSIPVRLLIDTGAGGAVHLSRSFMEAHPSFLEGRDTLGIEMAGLGGSSVSKVFRGGSLTLGGFTVPTGLCSVLPDIPVVSGFDGILGAAVLARFVIQLDYSTPSVVLEPSRLFAEGLPEDMAGISGRITGESIELTAVSPGSPAWEAGLREGDVLLSIDGIETGTDLVLVDSLSEGPAGAARTVRAVRDGSEFEARVVLRPLL